jgi:hypothetical protein
MARSGTTGEDHREYDSCRTGDSTSWVICHLFGIRNEFQDMPAGNSVSD